ncbi:DUF802 domain-containing protein [Paraburkholderia sp. DHOC27]|uniref:DUF802 domain-containing protein n=1 Tax=Paraburkholderia sp. DHOC27 TaxID=2303330 RepID=UPI000E3D3C66|nr:DUF802 domain-containing protein [Paraburkholderia sp. DHOC27]RFU46283.1 DUF802 domain-containing protein [Paraburkholderia sp. DHOC27]
MSSKILHIVVFLAGLAAVCWIGAGYVGSNPLALSVTLLIGVCYLAGALELQRYGEATATLTRALAGLSAVPSSFTTWLESLQPGLRNPVRLRVEGERVALPGPALTPYLVGLLVLLGMLGTLLGMVATLHGTGMALESATDLQAIRDSLAAPVKGLGFAFGTSIAGVATSAMLGLLSALCRRERLAAAQVLDTKIATTLRRYSQAHQREESLRALQRQADMMPTLVDRLHTMMAAIEQQNLRLSEHQVASQDAFHSKTEAAYMRLAASVERSLKASVAESARTAGAALQPVMEATLAGLARETSAMHESVTHAVQRQLDGVSGGLTATTATVAGLWTEALAGQERSNEKLVGDLRTSLEQFTAAFEQRSAGLVDSVSTRLAVTTGDMSATWQQAAAAFEQRSAGLADDVSARLAATTGDMSATWQQAAATFEQRSAGLVDGISTRLATTTGEMSAAWQQALAQHESVNEKLVARNQQALTEASATFAQHSASLLDAVSQSHATLQTEWASRDEQRLAAWRETLATMAANLNQQWEQTGARTAAQQQAICDTLEQTASNVSAQTQAYASETIAEIGRLVQAASEAPRAAAEVVAELRQKLSDSMVRDTAMLEERSRLLATLETLLDAVNHASTEQRTAVDALVSTSADLLDRVSTRFTDKVESETGKLGAIAAQVTGSAVEVASLGDAFGAAVHSFGASNDKLVAHLTRIEAALDKSVARSDEQLAYYVAQAREVVDLSVMSQKQIIEDLQQLARQRAVTGAEAA